MSTTKSTSKSRKGDASINSRIQSFTNRWHWQLLILLGIESSTTFGPNIYCCLFIINKTILKNHDSNRLRRSFKQREFKNTIYDHIYNIYIYILLYAVYKYSPDSLTVSHTWFGKMLLLLLPSQVLFITFSYFFLFFFSFFFSYFEFLFPTIFFFFHFFIILYTFFKIVWETL